MSTAEEQLLASEPETEQQLQDAIARFAQMHGWLVAHFRPARTRILEDGREIWATPLSYDGRGFPDLVLVRDRVVAIEVKSRTGKPTTEQRLWLYQWHSATNGDAYLVNPDGFEAMCRILAQKPKPGHVDHTALMHESMGL